jgi:hypothetical protein
MRPLRFGSGRSAPISADGGNPPMPMIGLLGWGEA